jgi:hypothetical protein
MHSAVTQHLGPSARRVERLRVNCREAAGQLSSAGVGAVSAQHKMATRAPFAVRSRQSETIGALVFFSPSAFE